MVEPGVGTTSFTYSATNGRLLSILDKFGDTTGFTYDAAGRISQKNNGNGTYETYSYDNLSRVTSVVTKNSSGTALQSRTYAFDLASQVTSVVEGAITTNYGYDNIGQLTSETKSTGYSGSYTYDGNGNRLTRTVNGVTENYSYDAGDKLLAITGGSDPRSFTYDAAGRTTGIVRGSGTTSFTYDFESRVTSITKPGTITNTFVYNGLDTRVGMTDSAGTKIFKRNGVGVTATVLSDGQALYSGLGSESRGGVKTYFHSALKNTDVQTSNSQNVTASKVYDAFGNVVSSTGTWASPFGYGGKFGYQEDPDSGLKLLGHRYYDSSTGRFLTRDPIKDGRNWYSYCGNEPVLGSDPDGLKPSYVQQVGQVFQGYGDALNPVNWWKGIVALVQTTGEKGLPAAFGLWLEGMKFWEKDDPRAFGQSFGGVLLLVAPLPKVPKGMRVVMRTVVGMRYLKGGKHMIPLAIVSAKIPKGFRAGPNKTRNGVRFTHPRDSHKNARLESKGGLHVHVHDGGRVVGQGGIILFNPPKNLPERHIPYEEYMKWKKWNQP